LLSHVDAGMTASNHAVKNSSIVDALVVAGPSEVGALPGVPNEPQWGYVTTWGLMAPPGTPADVIATLNAALNEAASAPEVREALIKNGYNPMIQTPAEATAYVKAEMARRGM